MYKAYIQGLGVTLASSPSLSVVPLPAPTQFLFVSWQSPLSLLGPARTSHPHPFPPACLPARLQTLQPESWIVVGKAAGLFAPEPAEKSQQSMANNAAGGFSIDRPFYGRVGSWV